MPFDCVWQSEWVNCSKLWMLCDELWGLRGEVRCGRVVLFSKENVCSSGMNPKNASDESNR